MSDYETQTRRGSGMNDTERMAFHERRKNGIGGSDVAALFGLSHFKTRLQLYMDKLGLAKQEETRAMRLGTRYESIIAEEYQIESGQTLTKGEYTPHPTCPRLFAHLDYMLPDGTPVELKRVGLHMEREWGKPGSDEIPAAYNLQVQSQMACTKANSAMVIAMFAARDELRTYTVPFSQKIADRVASEAERFFATHVVPRVPPDETDETILKEYLDAIYPKSEPITMQASESDQELLRRLFERTIAIREAEKSLLSVQNDIRERMGEHELLVSPIGKVYWKSSKPKETIDWRTIAQVMNPPAALVKTHTKITEGSRSFRAYLKGGETENE